MGKNVIQSCTDSNGIIHFLVKYDVTQDPSGHKRNKNASSVLSKECAMMLDSIVFPVGRATACLTVQAEIASMSM